MEPGLIKAVLSSPPTNVASLISVQTLERVKIQYINSQDVINHADEAVDDINEWWDFQTHGATKGFIERQHINPSTQVVLEQACWSGPWTRFPYASNYNWCAKKDFYLDFVDKVSDVTFITRSQLGRNRHLHTSFRDFQVVQIPYGDGLAMRLIFPERRDGLKDVVEVLNADPKWLDFKMDSYESLGEFWMPSFSLSYTHDINFGSEFFYPEEILEPAGLGKDEVDAIKMLQYAQVTVEGYERYPYTSAPVTMNMVGGEKTSFVADHPFMFIIRDTLSGLLLFAAGTVMNPVDG